MIKTSAFFLSAFITFAISAPSALAASTPKQQAKNTITIHGEAVLITCEKDGHMSAALATRIKEEEKALYEKSKEATLTLIKEEITRQGIPLDDIKKESMLLIEMSDTHAEQIEILSDELAEITARLARASAETEASSNGFLGAIIARTKQAKLATRKRRIEAKIADLISVRIELEGGIEKNRSDAIDIQTAIITSLKTPAMAKIEELMREGISNAEKAEIFCKAKKQEKNKAKAAA